MTVEYQIRHRLNDKERHTVEQFGDAAEKLWRTKVAGQVEHKTLLQVDIHYDWNSIDAVTGPRRVGETVTAPDDDDLAALQRQLRRFIMAREPTNFMRIAKTVGPALAAAAPARFSGFVDGRELEWKLPELRAFGCPVHGQELMRLWFNADLFHSDPGKQRRLDALVVSHGRAQIVKWQRFALASAMASVLRLHMFLRDKTDAYRPLDEGAAVVGLRAIEQ